MGSIGPAQRSVASSHANNNEQQTIKVFFDQVSDYQQTNSIEVSVKMMNFMNLMNNNI
jgi:hypothetical protein